MSRKYLSGAEKRKIQANKKLKEDEIVKKIPKISELFGAVQSTSTSTSESKSNAIGEENIDEVDSSTHEGNDENESMNIETEAMEILSGTIDFPASWDISKNITALQNYWINKGNVK